MAFIQRSIMLLVILMLSACSTTTKRCSKDKPDVLSILNQYPAFLAIEEDKDFNKKFLTYFEFLAKHESPDAVMMLKAIKSKDKTLDTLILIYHEKVEFKEWLNLGHKLKNMLVIKYNQKHYPKVYPIAHGQAMKEEMQLLKHYAKRRNFADIGELSYLLVYPLIENFPFAKSKGIKAITPKMFLRRARFNKDFFRTQVVKKDIDIAMAVFEDGGYHYKNRNLIHQSALDYLKEKNKKN